MKFCEESIIKTKPVHVYPNNKPWITKDLQVNLNQKKLAFLKGKKEEYKEKEKEFRKNVRAARLRYKNKVEEKLELVMLDRHGAVSHSVAQSSLKSLPSKRA